MRSTTSPRTRALAWARGEREHPRPTSSSRCVSGYGKLPTDKPRCSPTGADQGEQGQGEVPRDERVPQVERLAAGHGLLSEVAEGEVRRADDDGHPRAAVSQPSPVLQLPTERRFVRGCGEPVFGQAFVSLHLYSYLRRSSTFRVLLHKLHLLADIPDQRRPP